MVAIDLIERLSGTGPTRGKNGDLVGNAAYELRVYQELHQTRGESVPGLKRIEGHVEGLDNFRLLGKTLTLELVDGRRLDFFISDSNGKIANSGPGLYRSMEE